MIFRNNLGKYINIPIMSTSDKHEEGCTLVSLDKKIKRKNESLISLTINDSTLMIAKIIPYSPRPTILDQQY